MRGPRLVSSSKGIVNPTVTKPIHLRRSYHSRSAIPNTRPAIELRVCEATRETNPKASTSAYQDRSLFSADQPTSRASATMHTIADAIPMLLEAVTGQIPESRPSSSRASDGQIAALTQVQHNSRAYRQ